MERKEKIQKLIAIKELQVMCTAVVRLVHPKDAVAKGFETARSITFSEFSPDVQVVFHEVGYRAYINDRLTLSDSWQDTHDETIEMFLDFSACNKGRKKKRHTTIRKKSKAAWGKATESKIARENWFASCLSG
jgi:hypothetical protein